MGLIKAITGAAGGVLADQWKEYFYADAIPADVLVTKGEKRTSGRSSNTKGEDNIISNGSVIAVNEGQFMIIVEQGKVVEFCGEPGEFKYDTSTEPSLFAGEFGEAIVNTFKTIGKRFTFGGDTAKDQRVYFFNKKEIPGNRYGTATPIPFRVVDNKLGLDLDISIRCNGEYSYKIVDPLLFYTNVCGNVTYEYKRSEIDSMLKTELMTAMQPAFAKISALGVRYSEVPAHTVELADALNEVLSKKWTQTRGLAVFSFGINSMSIPEEDQALIKNAQMAAINRDPTMAAATLVTAQGQAMRDAAKNEGGAMNGFIGMNMANNAGGMNAQNLFAMGQGQAQAAPAATAPADSWTCKCGKVNTGKFCAECGEKKPEPKPAAGSWSCKCGTVNTGKFCSTCGEKKPDDPNSWTCKCGAVNKGRFCAECGEKKPAGTPTYKCDKCGWEPKDPAHPPKFCPECGDLFDDHDAK